MASSSDLPALACANDWLPVTDLVTGAERGQLQVTLAAGTEEQLLRRLMPQLSEGTSSAAGTPRTTTADRDDDDKEQESEHLYDTVGDEEDPEEEEEEEVANEGREETVVSLTSTLPPPTTTQLFKAKVRVEEARKLPRVFDPVRKEKVAPSTFITFSSASGARSTIISPLATETSNPRWDFEATAEIGSEVLVDPRRHFILKLWHHHHQGHGGPDLESDHVMGFAAVDLAPLRAAGFADVCGWYNIMDFVGRCRGQIKVSITPQEDIR